jgi:basic membrane protein A
MDDDRHDSYRSDSDAVAELEALRRIREELWAALRGEDDPELRISLLSRLSENRAAILRLGEELGLENPQPGAMETSRSVVVDPSAADDLDDRYFSYGAPSAVGSGPLGPESPMPEPGPRRPPGPRATGPQRRLTVHEPSPSSRWALVLIGGLVLVLAVTWLALARPFSSLFDDESASNVAAEGDDDSAAGPEADQRVSEIAAVLQGLGLDGIQVERRGSEIFLSGTVTSQADWENAVAAANALAGDSTVNASELIVQAGDTAVESTDDVGRAAQLQAEIDRIVAVTPLIFEQGSSDLSDLHLRILNNVAAILKAYPNLPVTILGFTDDLGSDENNRQLSLGRAESVRGYLVAQGVAESQLQIDARGEDAASGAPRLANLERRVEFEVVVPAGGEALPSNENPLRIAIVAPSASNDLAFTQSMVDAVNVIANERGNVEVAVTDNAFVVEEAAAAIRDYASQGYNLVIAHGSQYGTDLAVIAGEFPDVAFAWGTASDTFGLPNVYAYDAAAEQGGYVQGAMSAMLSGTGTIGVVGPIEVGDAQRYIDGFDAGAKAALPTANVLVTYTGSFSEITLAAEAAQAHIGAGADVMTGSAQMVVGAVSVANESGVLWFGTQANQASMATSLVVSSQVYHWEVILRQIVSDIDAGAPSGGNYTADLANGGLIIEYNPGYQLPAEVRQRADQITAEIANGVIAVPS